MLLQTGIGGGRTPGNPRRRRPLKADETNAG